MTLTAIADDDDPRRALRVIAELRRQLARREAAQVRAARVRGLSWAEIATALGLPRRTVRARYHGRGGWAA